MKKKAILNTCMVLTIILLAMCGAAAVGYVKGWFGNASELDLIILEKTGIAMVERSGVVYEADAGTVIREADKLSTQAASALTITDSEKTRIYMNNSTEIALTDGKASMNLEVIRGETLIDARELQDVRVKSGETQIQMGQAVATVSTQTGSSMVYVYAGEIVVEGGTEKLIVAAGEVATIIHDTGACQTVVLNAESLNDEQMAQLIACGMDNTFWFTEADLEAVKTARQEELRKVQMEALQLVDGAEGDMYCTIEIECSTILNNMADLTAGKEGYVPEDGIVLETCKVAFNEGETVFDVLQRVCESLEIQIEYSYTPLYESYYIEGINHLYEFDCGYESGWMYKVNGWFPNYGCSGYPLADGDSIVWCYTCKGLGVDVGGTGY